MDGYIVNREKIFLTLIASIAAIGGFLFGYDTGIISGALIFIQKSFAVSTFTQEIIVSAVVLGALMGSIFSGKLADRFGRRPMLLSMAITFIIGTVMSTMASHVSILILARLILGITIGITSYICPLYISEIAPPKQRGALVLLNGIMITGGQAVAFLVDYFLTSTQSWRLMFATGLVPAILFLLGMLILPCSPRWMILKGCIDNARTILKRIRHPDAIETEINDILQHATTESHSWSLLFSKWLRPVLIIGIALGFFQQFMGINTVMYYGPSIFKSAGFNSYQTQILATFGMGLVNMLMTIVAVLIVDKIGRRRMLSGGLFLAGVSLSIISFIFNFSAHTALMSWLTFIFMFLYIAGYSISLGSLFWLIIAEIYPLQIRGLAMSFVTALQWAFNFFVSATFLSAMEFAGPVFIFLFYSAICLGAFIFCYRRVPETRGISLEHIEKNLRSGIHSRELGNATL